MKYTYYLKKFWRLYFLAAVICLAATIAAERTVTTVAESMPIPRSHVLVIDAGHGGVDGGATSCSGVLESHINLQIAMRLNDLCRLLGYETKMIRISDISVYTEGNTIAAKKVSDLKRRVEIVDQTKNAILISIHQNIFADSRYSGAQVFYANTPGSRELADVLQSALISAFHPESRRNSKVADHIYLMQNIHRIGVLVECGFLSNPEEEANLRNPAYQKKLCCVIASGLSNYINP